MMKLFAVESNGVALDGGAMFGNAPKGLWSKWIDPDLENRVQLSCRSLLVEVRGKYWLFEAGGGAFYAPKMRERYGIEREHRLLMNLQKLGITEEMIDGVILSHLHFDHAGGLLLPYGEEQRLLFPKATYFVGRTHWASANEPHPRERASFIPELQELLGQSGRLQLIEGDTDLNLGFTLNFFVSEGHTKGMLLSMIEFEEELLVYAADLVPGLPWMRLPIAMGYDRFAERLVDEKRALLEGVAKRGGRLFFTHDKEVACARIKQSDEGKFLAEPCAL